MTGAGVDSAVRPDGLAILLQETLTATVRLRSGRQHVADAQSFRAQLREALRIAEQQAGSAGYSAGGFSLAAFAVVAFLDESILNLQNPVFAGWPGKPLQDELFGGHVAGETFFENLSRLLAQPDSPELADVLEVYQLCMLLGYRGRHAMGTQGELSASVAAVREKMRRIRGTSAALAPQWAPPANESVPVDRDPWIRPLSLACGVGLLLVLALLLAFHWSLGSGLNEIRVLDAAVAAAP
jgi:type VI secretion system protein ImpK